MPTAERTQKILSVLAQRQQGIIVLEDIFDPHNAAAILRSCDAFGFQYVQYVFDKVKKYNPKKVGKGSSVSANKWLGIEVVATIEECYAKLREEGYTIYATTLDQSADEHKPVDLYGKLPMIGPKVAIVFGNEHGGISQYASDHADYHLHISMRGFVESFNVSVCAALVLAEFTRQRIEEGIEKYVLMPDDKETLRKVWLKT